MQVDHSFPERLRPLCNLRAQRLAGVEERALPTGRATGESIEQQADMSRLAGRAAGSEGPELRVAQVALDGIPLRGGLERPIVTGGPLPSA